MEKYTILMTIFTTGQCSIVVTKEKVREMCENLKSANRILDKDTYARIEVINNQTGEIREYWNNKENKIQF